MPRRYIYLFIAVMCLSVSVAHAQSGYFMHTLKKGETLSSLAQKYNTTAGDIMRLNKMHANSKLVYGSQIKIPGQPETVTQQPMPGTAVSDTALTYTTHTVTKGETLFSISKQYNVNCRFEKVTDSIGFTMKTSANTLKHYFRYGKLRFNIAGTEYQLFVYQSEDLMKTEQYKNYLFVPFTDLTTGDESYGSGRYLEFYINDIREKNLQLDFNKAYNPYCAYSPGFKCPVPPKENALNVAIRAGEKNFAKPH